MPVNSRAHASKFICMNEMNVYDRRNKLARRVLCPGYPLPFLKCANGTLLPLTLGDRFVRMKSSIGKIFATLPERRGCMMAGRVTAPSLSGGRDRTVLSMGHVRPAAHKVGKG